MKISNASSEHFNEMQPLFSSWNGAINENDSEKQENAVRHLSAEKIHFKNCDKNQENLWRQKRKQ